MRGSIYAGGVTIFWQADGAISEIVDIMRWIWYLILKKKLNTNLN
jgi:hypothetical protein